MTHKTTNGYSGRNSDYPRLADPVAHRLGSLLLFVITLMLSPVVCADSQTEIEDAGSFGIVDTAPAYKEDPAEPKVVPKERWYTPLATDPG